MLGRASAPPGGDQIVSVLRAPPKALELRSRAVPAIEEKSVLSNVLTRVRPGMMASLAVSGVLPGQDCPNGGRLVPIR